VLDAYAERDAEGARAVWIHDADLDALEDSVFRDLLTFMMEDPRNISFCTHLLFVSKNIERIGDHATNIAETVVYLVTEKPCRWTGPKAGPLYLRRLRRGLNMGKELQDINEAALPCTCTRDNYRTCGAHSRG